MVMIHIVLPLYPLHTYAAVHSYNRSTFSMNTLIRVYKQFENRQLSS